MALATSNIRSTMDTVTTQNIPNSPGSASDSGENGIDQEDQETCWYEITLREEMERKEWEAAQGKHQAAAETSSHRSAADSKSTPAEELVMSSLYKTANERQIEIDILDSANVKKYEKLVKSDLIKSPFKRRLSGGSSGDDVDEANLLGMNCDRDDDTESNLFSKRSKKDDNDPCLQRLRRESSSSGTSSQASRRQVEYETDEAVLLRRQKQIDYGKNTLGYENYIKQVPRHERTVEQPRTPQKHLKYSRRAWDGLIKIWRKQLHCYDPNSKLEDDK